MGRNQNSPKGVVRITGAQVLKLRKALGLSQEAFWAALGPSQSCGSRYEAGNQIPLETEVLLRYFYLGQNIDQAMNQLIPPSPDSEVPVDAAVKAVAAIQRSLKIRS